MTQVTLIRHGAVEGPPALYGHTDIALSDTGRDALRQTLLACDTPDHIVSSPLMRCAEIARELALTLQIPIRFDKQLQEMNFGHWDGIAFNKHDPDWSKKEKFWSNPALHAPPGGETLATMAQRVLLGWAQCLTLQSQHLAVLTHGGVIRLLLAHCFALDWREPGLYQSLHVDYACAVQIEINDLQQARICSVKGVAFKGKVPTALQRLEEQLIRCQNA